MKRLFFLCFVFSAAILAYSADPAQTEQENSLSWGLEWGISFENEKEGGDTYNGFYFAPGLAIHSAYFTKDKSFGFFMNGFVLFPAYLSLKENGKKTDLSISDIDLMMQFGFLFGPAYRIAINNRWELCCGLGFDFSFLFADMGVVTPPYNVVFDGTLITKANGSSVSVLFGIGGDIRFRFHFSNAFFLSGGSSFTWNFSSYSSEEYSFKVSGKDYSYGSSGWDKNYNMFSIRPYICFGINIYTKTESRLGKAP